MNISLTSIHKSFNKKPVLEDISLSFKVGQVYGLLGKNGAGKTTLLNILIQLIRPTSGAISFDGQQYASLPNGIKLKMGILSEDNPVIEELTAMQYLKLNGKMYGIPDRELNGRIGDLIGYFFEELDEKKPLLAFSTGMKKKVGLCAAVLHTPEILILDEPFSGLDPLAAQQCIRFLRLYKKENRTIILSSHDLNYVEQLVTHIAVLDKMRIQYDGTLEDFTRDGKNRIDQALFEVLKADTPDSNDIKWI